MICAGNDRLFAKLADVMERPDWSSDPRFTGNRARLVNKDALVAEMAPILLTVLGNTGSLCCKSPACRRHRSTAFLKHWPSRKVQALGMAVPVPGEDFSLTGLPLSFDGARPTFAHGAPQLGQDNAAYGVPDV